MVSGDSTDHGNPSGLWCQHVPRTSAWSPMAIWTTNTKKAHGGSPIHRHQHGLRGYTGHEHQHGTQLQQDYGPRHGLQQGSWTSMWPQGAAQATHICLALSGIRAHRHETWLQGAAETAVIHIALRDKTGHRRQHSPG